MTLRKATIEELPAIWKILQQAIEHRRLDGSTQWQNGYPNEQTVINDISLGAGFVLVENDEIIAYSAIIFGVEPTYNQIIGQWLSNGNYVVIHRVACANRIKGKGVATKLFEMIEKLAMNQKVFSIKVDTNFDNVPMLKILDKLGYTYCGEVFVSGAARRAYEKLLADTESNISIIK